MRFKKLLLLSLTATAISAPIAMASCSSQTNSASAEEQLSRQSDMANLFRIQAAEYLASIRQQYAGATEQLKTLIRSIKDTETNLDFDINEYNSSKADEGNYQMQEWKVAESAEVAETKGFSNNTETEYPAIVVDLDETFLDNTPISIRNALENLSHNEAKDAEGGWRAWVASGQAYLMPGVKEFVETAYRNGVVVLFDSDRMQDVDREGTEKSLKNWGYKDAFNKNENYWMKGVEHGNKNDDVYYNSDYYSSTKDREEITKKLHNYGAGIPKYLKDTYYTGNDEVKVDSEKIMKLAKHKEARFQFINDWTNYQIIMRVGDNIDDFNSFGTKYKLNEVRRKWTADNKNKFTPGYVGDNDDDKYSSDALYDLSTISEIRYSPVDGKKIEPSTTKDGKTTVNYTPGYDIYIAIGNNLNYGGWESGTIENYYGQDTLGKVSARIKGAIPTWLNEGWDGTKDDKFLTSMEKELKEILTNL